MPLWLWNVLFGRAFSSTLPSANGGARKSVYLDPLTADKAALMQTPVPPRSLSHSPHWPSDFDLFPALKIISALAIIVIDERPAGSRQPQSRRWQLPDSCGKIDCTICVTAIEANRQPVRRQLKTTQRIIQQLGGRVAAEWQLRRTCSDADVN